MVTANGDVVNHGAKLDRLILDHVADRLATWSPQRRQVLLARVGWLGPRKSLQAAASALGISKQAAQGIVEKGLGNLRPVPEMLAVITNDAWDLAVGMAPARWTRVRESLVQRAYIDAIDFDGFLALGDLVDTAPRLTMHDDYLVSGETPPLPVVRAIRLLKSKVRAGGACRMTAVIDELGLSSVWNPEDFANDVTEAGWARPLYDDWVAEASPPKGSDRLANLSRKVLAVCGPTKVEVLAAGLERQVRFGRLPAVPPAHVLSAYFSSHLDFEIENETITPLRPLTPEHELSRTEFAIWRRFRDVGGGSLSRSDLRAAARNMGIDLAAFASALSYSPVLESRAHGQWALRSSEPATPSQSSEAPVAVLRKVASRTSRASRYTWDDQGRLVITSILSSPESTVVAIPQAVQVILDGKEFTAIDEDGNSVGTIKVRGGRSWGYDRYLANRRGQRGDLLMITFDLAQRSSTLGWVSVPVPND